MPSAEKADSASVANRGRPSAETARRSSWELLRHRYFRRYFLGTLGSNLGTWLQGTAQVLLAYRLTHSAFAVGLVVSAQYAGTLLLSPWAAVLADRIGSRTTLVGTQAASAVVAATMAWRYHYHMLGVHSLVLGALSLGLAFALALPVQTALVPALVDAADTEAAMAMNSASYNTGRALAPALCVPVMAFAGAGLIFALNAASFAIFAVILCLLKPGASQGGLAGWPRQRPPQRPRQRPGQRPRRVRITDGFRAARRNRRILLLLAIVAAVTLADDPVQVLSPGLAHGLHLPSDWAGYFIAALGWGAVLGSLPPTSRRAVGNPSHASRRAAWWLLVLAVSIAVFTAGGLAPITVIAAACAGVAALRTGAAAQALILGQDRKTAASIAGLWALAWAGTKPVASLLDGWLASHLGIWPAGLLLAFPAAVLALCEILISTDRKKCIKKWSLSSYLDTHPPSFQRMVLSAAQFILRLLRLDDLHTEESSECTAAESANC